MAAAGLTIAVASRRVGMDTASAAVAVREAVATGAATATAVEQERAVLAPVLADRHHPLPPFR